MPDFESFLIEQRGQATQAPGGALAPPAATPAPDAGGGGFEGFLRSQKGEQDQAVLQQATATTVVNAQQGSATAAAAAPVSRQLGLPQAAVEADLPRFQQQAKADANSSLLATNPVLARWVAANPDSARIAQDEYDKLGAIAKLWDGTKGVGYAGLQGLASSFSSASLAVNRQIGNVLTIGGLGPNAASQWWQRNMVGTSEADQALLAPAPDAGFGQRAAGMAGNLLGLLSQITLTGGASEAAPAAAGVGEFLAHAGQTAGRLMAFPSLTAATNKGAEVFEKTGDQSAAVKAAVAEYLFSTAQGVVPFSAPGSVLTRLGTGAVSGVATAEGQRAAMNLLLPEQMQQKFDPQEALFQAVSGAVLGGVMGPHGEPNYMGQIRQTYVDALKAEQAQRDVGKVAALGQISANMKLREADAPAFKRFVEMVSENSNLEAVYIDPKELQGALAQSGVDISKTMPDVMRQLGEGAIVGTDVRIPVADFATHVAGTDLEKAMLPSMKAAPDGMTFREGEAFFQDAAKNMQDRAKEMAKAQEQDTGFQEDRQAVTKAIYDQLVAAGSTPEAAKAQAAMHEAFYTTQAQRLGIKPSEALAQFPVRIASEGQGGLQQPGGAPEHVTLDSLRESWTAKGIEHSLSEKDGVIEVGKIVVPEGSRKQGIGTEAMRELVRYANESGQRIELTPSTDFGATSVARLKKFYKQFGFVENKGKNKDFATMAGMFREPQKGLEQGQRGAYFPDSHTIALLKDADLSTLLHESGHHFFETLRQMASTEKAPLDIKADFDTLMRHYGVEGATPEERLANWSAKDLEGQRDTHEKFARSFERYLMEGKAPTFELQPIFSRFRSWLMNVYRSFKGLGADLSPEVREVMDRLLASDAAIKETEAARSYAPLWKTAEEAGMTPEQFKAYVAQGQEASSRALDEMQAKSVQDMKWASRAKSRALRQLQREAAGARRDVRAEVSKEVDAMPIFQLKDYLASIKNYDPDIVANAHGFEDAHHMEQALHAAGDKKEAIERLTDQRMLEQYGELLSPEAIEQAANDAVHNEARARFMATGLKVLTKSPLPATQIALAAKQAADIAIGMKRIVDLNPKTYQQAETRANRDAIKAAAKDPQAAIEAQRAAVLSNRLAKSAQDALAEVQKGLKYLRRFNTPEMGKAVGAEYMDRINELLSAYDLSSRTASKEDVQTRQEMREWLASEFQRTGVMPEVSDGLLDFTQRRQGKELQFAEFLGLVDSVRSLEHVGRSQTQLTILGKSIALAGLVATAKADLVDMPHNPPVDLQPHLQHASGLDKMSAQWLNLKSKVRGMDAALVKMEQLFQWLTYGKRAGLGENRTGPFLQIFQRISLAEGVERSKRAESAADMRHLGEQLKDAKVDLNESLQLPLQRPGRGGQWYREELIAAALNTGNKGNLDKLTKGYKWDAPTLMRVLDENLSKAEWQFVQGVWDAVGKYGPQIEALQKRMTGVGPKMVEPLAVKTQHGDFKGGYYPVVYDAFLDRSIEQKADKNADALFENQWAKPTTSQGHTVARTGYVGPIQLSLGVIGRHLEQVTHDLAWREAIVDTNKFLSHQEIQKEVDEVMGREYRKQFRPWLQAMANDRVFNSAGDSAWEGFYRKARSNATMVGLGFRLSTMLIHGGSALSNSIGELGATWFAKGAAEFATPERWERAKAFMYDRSPEMANRFNEFDRNIREAINEINEHEKSLGPVSVTQRTVDAARRFAFYGVQALDMGSAAPTWMGAYLKGMAPEAKGGLGLSEEAAVDLANRAVRNAHGGGGVKDLSAVQRDKGVISLATMFYSYWNHMYNRQRDIAKGFANLPAAMQQGTGTRDFAKLLARSWFYFVIPQLIHAALKPTPQDEQEDTLAGHMAHLGKEIALGFVSGVPVLRDLANAAVNGRDYAISPLEQAGKSIVKATTDTYKYAAGEEPSAHAGKNAVLATGYLVGLPVGQAATAGPFLWDVFNGNADAQGIKDWYDGVSRGHLQ